MNVEEIVRMMEEMPPIECGPSPHKCHQWEGRKGEACPIHAERMAVMAEAFWKVYDAEEAQRASK